MVPGDAFTRIPVEEAERLIEQTVKERVDAELDKYAALAERLHAEGHLEKIIPALKRQ